MAHDKHKINDVRIKVVSQKGTCLAGHKVGDEWVVGIDTPKGLCHEAFFAMYTFMSLYQRGGTYSYPFESGICRVCCPDPWNPVLFELSRIPETARDDPSADLMPESAGDLSRLPYNFPPKGKNIASGPDE